MKDLERIIKDCIKGKDKSRELLYRTFAPKMFGVCLQYSRDYTEAEDTLQDGFIKVFQNIKSYGFNGSFEGWIRRIMVNTALEKYRKNRKLYMVDQVDDVVDDSEDLGSPQLPMDLLLKMVQELPDRYRMVFNLYVMDGYTHQQISREMGISDGTSKSNLARARMILKKKVKEYIGSQENNKTLTVC